jgi:hypothetical protein
MELENLSKHQCFVYRFVKFFQVSRIIAKELEVLSNEIEPDKIIRVLDIGAGPAKYWNDKVLLDFFCKRKVEITLFDATEESGLASPSELISVSKIVGIAPNDLDTFGDSEFDLVIALDLIEHLTKEDGYSLLYQLDRLALKSSLIFTPNGFVWQPPSLNNPFNAHISAWKPRELRQLGWKQQYGNVGFSFFVGPYGLLKYNSRVINLLNTLALPIVRFFPSLGFSFTAIKRQKNSWIKEQRLS